MADTEKKEAPEKKEEKKKEGIPSPVPTTPQGIPYNKPDGTVGHVIWNEQTGEYEDED